MIPPKVLAVLVERSGGVCEVCGVHAAGQTHHRRPKGAGGTRRADANQPANLLRVCGTSSTQDCCHQRIESDRADAYANGWLVRQTHTPTETPVLYRGQWVWLDNNGDIEWKDAA